MKQLLIILVLICIMSGNSIGQTMRSLNFSPWVANTLTDTMEWVGPTDTNFVNVCVLEGNNHRNGYPGVFGTYNYNYQEAWFETWWDDAGVISSTSDTPSGLHVWSSGIDTILFCFSKLVEGDSNFLYFHQVDFSNTQITIQAYNCGTLLNHNLVELNESSGTPSFTTSATEAIFTLSAGANRRHLVRFNQDFDFVMIIENNPADLLAVGFMGFGNFKQNVCSFCNIKTNPVLDGGVVQLEARKTSGSVLLSWNTYSHLDRYVVERLYPDNVWKELATFKSSTSPDSSLFYRDNFPQVGENVYRIRSIDNNGSEYLSKLQSVHVQPKIGLTIYPNPAKGNVLLLQFDKAIDNLSLLQLQFFDQSGKEFNLPFTVDNAFTLEVNIDLLTSGLYYVMVQNSDGHFFTEKVQVR